MRRPQLCSVLSLALFFAPGLLCGVQLRPQWKLLLVCGVPVRLQSATAHDGNHRNDGHNHGNHRDNYSNYRDNLSNYGHNYRNHRNDRNNYRDNLSNDRNNYRDNLSNYGHNYRNHI